MPAGRHSEIEEATYENIVVCCPWCGHRNIFNRVTDLHSTRPVAHGEVVCCNAACGQPFSISNDSINAVFEMLIFDCYQLQREKHYVHCILNLAQSFEAFFSQFLRVEILYRPYAAHGQDLGRLNQLAGALYEKIERLTFYRMRNIFLHRLLARSPLHSLDDAENWIHAFTVPSEPQDAEIQSIADHRLAELLMRLKRCTVAGLRNRVVHKAAYRPSLEEVQAALEETRQIVPPLAHLLDVRSDDLNVYLAKAAEARRPISR